MTNCNHCNTEVAQHYCPNCGQAAKIKRIDGQYIIHEIEHVLHFERGILYTIRELISRPGKNVRNYLTENRSRLVKPVIFIIVTSLVYSLVSHFFHIEESYGKKGPITQSAVNTIFKWVQDHYGYANIIMGVFIALFLKLFFRKPGYNFFEILILLCFVMGMGMLIYAVFALIEGITHFHLMSPAGVVGIAYAVWAIGQFFEPKRALGYIKSFAAYMLGMMTFWLVGFLAGTLIDLIIK